MIETNTLLEVGEALCGVVVLQHCEYLNADMARAALAAATAVVMPRDGQDDDLHPYAREWIEAHHVPVDSMRKD